MSGLTISEVAQRSGLKPSAIRYYESLNLLTAVERISGQRRFEPTVLERLSFIQTARGLGFSLAEIQSILQDQPANRPLNAHWQFLARKKLNEIKTLIQEAQSIQKRLQEGIDCTCANLEDCIDCVLAHCRG